MSFRIRQTAPEELGLLKQLAENEGLNPGLNDIASVYQADPAGFFTCLSGDKPAGFISAIKYGSRYGFIGLFLIYPEFRNTAAAPILFRTAYKYLAKSNAGMDIPFKFVARIEYTGAKFAHKI
ncbi:MAG: GNAT family N-acetyltransferase, partial [Bacteroidota bacterium]